MVPHTVQADGQGDERGAANEAQMGRMPPVEPVAIVEHIGHLQAQHGPKQRAEPVDAFERHYLGHGVERTGEQALHGEHEEHEAGNEPVHEGPMVQKGELRRQIGGELHGGEQHDVEQGEEDGKVALGGHP